jgi:DnaJ-class molecular chaperone
MKLNLKGKNIMNNPTLPKDLRGVAKQQLGLFGDLYIHYKHDYPKQASKLIDEYTDSILTIVRTKLIEELPKPKKVKRKTFTGKTLTEAQLDYTMDLLDELNGVKSGYNTAIDEVLSVINLTLGGK